MTVEAVTTLAEPGRNVRGTFKLGDLALRIVDAVRRIDACWTSLPAATSSMPRC